MSRCMFRASEGQNCSDPNNDKEGREEKEGRAQRRENNPRLHSRLLAEPGKEPS